MEPGKLQRTASGGAVLPGRTYELLELAVESATPRGRGGGAGIPEEEEAPLQPPSRLALQLAAARSRLPSRDAARAPLQLFIAMLAASLLACSARSAAAFRHHGVWGVITVTSASRAARLRAGRRRRGADARVRFAVALETNVGATWRKASLRALGTLAGGALGAAVVGAVSQWLTLYTTPVIYLFFARRLQQVRP